MICPYCKHEILVNAEFCPECGQKITNNTSQNQVSSYWENVNRKNIGRSKEYRDIVTKDRHEIRIRKIKVTFIAALILIIFISSTFGIIKFQQYQTQMVKQIKTELVGKTFITHSSHIEGFGWVYHEYWQLSFIDENKLDYSYIKTSGPAEEDEQPQYIDTYSYTIVRSITGKYTVEVNGTTFELYVNEENIPQGISS